MARKKTGERKRGRKPSDERRGYFTVTRKDGTRGVADGWRRITIFIDSSYWPELKAHASLRGVEPSSIINQLLGDFLQKNPIRVRSK